MCDFSVTHLGNVSLLFRNNAFLESEKGKARTKKSIAQKRIFFVPRGGSLSQAEKFSQPNRKMTNCFLFVVSSFVHKRQR